MALVRHWSSGTVGADAYWERARQKAVFDADLTGQGVLAIQVLIQNRGQHPVKLRRDTFTLELSDGALRSPITAAQVAGPAVEPAGPVTWTDIGGGHPLFVLPFALGFALSEGVVNLVKLKQQRYEAYNVRLSDYRFKEFPNWEAVRPGEELHGFVFFQYHPMGESTAPALRVRIESMVGADDEDALREDTVVRLPLSR